jgi:tRNA(Ile)-lysidine synthase
MLLLNALSKELNLSLHIAHLNHGLRGKESKQDADFVLRLAQRFKLPATIKEINVAKLASKGSLEQAARKARLEFLFEVARKLKTDKVALGHTLDDQAETVLMRLIRGSGLLGLSGILPKRKIGKFIIVRPLLEVSREEIESFLKTKRIKPRIDYTNRQEIYFRNRIRHQLLPLVRKYNPNIKSVLTNTAQNLAVDYDYILKNGLRVFNALKISKTKSKIKLPLDGLLKLHPSLQNMVLRLAFEELKGDTRQLTFQHIRELKGLMRERPHGSIVDLPSCISARKDPKQFCMYMP